MIYTIHLVRKPLGEDTLEDNHLAWETGAINVDATRIETVDNLSGGAYADNGTDREDGYDKWRYKRLGGAGEYVQPSGRWPSNLVLEHIGECQCVGTKKVKWNNAELGKAPTKYRRTVYSSTALNKQGSFGFAPDGYEFMKDWECHPDCPVDDVEEQSSFSSKNSEYAGGASRFFLTFKQESQSDDD